jgi:hypothetical protein
MKREPDPDQAPKVAPHSEICSRVDHDGRIIRIIGCNLVPSGLCLVTFRVSCRPGLMTLFPNDQPRRDLTQKDWR